MVYVLRTMMQWDAMGSSVLPVCALGLLMNRPRIESLRRRNPLTIRYHDVIGGGSSNRGRAAPRLFSKLWREKLSTTTRD